VTLVFIKVSSLKRLYVLNQHNQLEGLFSVQHSYGKVEVGAGVVHVIVPMEGETYNLQFGVQLNGSIMFMHPFYNPLSQVPSKPQLYPIIPNVWVDNLL
jgi:hypothetical protein